MLLKLKSTFAVLITLLIGSFFAHASSDPASKDNLLKLLSDRATNRYCGKGCKSDAFELKVFPIGIDSADKANGYTTKQNVFVAFNYSAPGKEWKKGGACYRVLIKGQRVLVASPVDDGGSIGSDGLQLCKVWKNFWPAE